MKRSSQLAAENAECFVWEQDEDYSWVLCWACDRLHRFGSSENTRGKLQHRSPGGHCKAGKALWYMDTPPLALYELGA